MAGVFDIELETSTKEEDSSEDDCIEVDEVRHSFLFDFFN